MNINLDLMRSTARFIVANVEPSEGIGRGGSVYMNRWWLNRDKVRDGNTYLHHFLRNDVEDFHDHPWWSVSYILQGGYTEEILEKSGRIYSVERVPGDIVPRTDLAVHRITGVKPDTLTYFTTGPKVKEWGFITPHGWVHHKQYEAYKTGVLTNGN